MENPMRYNLATRTKEKFILDSIEPKRGDKILDIGCGIGYFTFLLAKKGSTYGIDIEKESLKFVEKNLNVVNGDALELPFRDNTFEWVLSSEVLEHIRDGDKFLGEISRIMNKNGKLVLTAPSSEGILGVSSLCHTKRYEYHYRDGYKEKELIEVLEKNGFKVAKMSYNMAIFSRIIMEITKLIYNFINPSFEKQCDIFRTKDSLIFKIYKKIFFILLIIDYFDSQLTKILKGSGIMILAEKLARNNKSL